MANVINDLGIEISINDWNQFLADLSAMMDTQTKSFDIENGMKEIAQYLNISAKWYHFLIQFHDVLLEYKRLNISTKNTAIAILKKICCIKENELKSVNEIGLMQFFNATSIKIYIEVEHIEVNQVKLNELKYVLQQSVNSDGSQRPNQMRQMLRMMGKPPIRKHGEGKKNTSKKNRRKKKRNKKKRAG